MDSLAHLFIRHPRAQYVLDDLGPSQFEYDRCQVSRRDFEVQNERKNVLKCSCFVPANSTATQCLLYLHGSAGCRLDSFADFAVEVALCCRLPIVNFDFSGAGLSDGDFISLGYREQHDVARVVEYVKQHLQEWTTVIAPITPVLTTTATTATTTTTSTTTTTATTTPTTTTAATNTIAAMTTATTAAITTATSTTSITATPTITPKFCIWGRSMGAVAALLFAASQPTDVAEHLIGQWFANKPFQHALSGVTAATALPAVRRKIQQLVPGFDIKEFSPLLSAPAASAPVLFVHGKEDTFVPPTQSQLLYEAYGKNLPGVEKRYCSVEGTHNGRRPPEFIDDVLRFLHSQLKVRLRQYYPPHFGPGDHSPFGMSVRPFLKQQQPSAAPGAADQKQGDDLSSLLPESISIALPPATKGSAPPFRSERVLCIHPSQGLALKRALTAQLEFALGYEQLARFGALEGGEGVFILSQQETEPRLFWAEAKTSKQFQEAVEANVNALIQGQLQDGKESARQKMLSNLEFAATTLIEAELAKGRQPDVCQVSFSLCGAMAEVLGEEPSQLCRPVAEAVLRVAQGKLTPPPVLTAEEIAQRFGRDPPAPAPKPAERKKSCVVS